MPRIVAAFMVLVLSLVLFAGCSDEKSSGVVGTAQPGASSEKGQGYIQSAESSDVGFSVRIVPQNPRVGQSLRARVAGATPSRYLWRINGQAVDGQAEAGLDGRLFAKGDEVTVSALSEGSEVTTRVVVDNTPPQVLSVVLANQAIHRGVDIELQPVGEDADDDPIEFRTRWAVNNVTRMFYDDQTILPGEEFERGDRIHITVVPFDGEDEGEPYVAEEFVIPNAAPQFVSIPEGQFDGINYVCQVVAEDADGDSLVYILEEGPEEMTIDSLSGQISWKVGEVPAGSVKIRVAADDGFGGNTVQAFSLSLAAGEGKP